MIFSSFSVPFVINFLAELGDKTQLLALSYVLKYRQRKGTIVLAIFLSTSLLMALAVLVGGVIEPYIPKKILRYIVSIIFFVWGLLTLFIKEEEAEETQKIKSVHLFSLIFLSFSMAELGDKTQIVTFALSLKYTGKWFVWLGSTLGMGMVNIITIIMGHTLFSNISMKKARYLAGGLFVLFALLNLLIN